MYVCSTFLQSSSGEWQSTFLQSKLKWWWQRSTTEDVDIMHVSIRKRVRESGLNTHIRKLSCITKRPSIVCGFLGNLVVIQQIMLFGQNLNNMYWFIYWKCLAIVLPCYFFFWIGFGLYETAEKIFKKKKKKDPFSSMFGTPLLWCLNLTFEWNGCFCLGARNPLRTLMKNALQTDFTQKQTKVCFSKQWCTCSVP